MTQRTKQAILSLLVVGQLGMVGCVAPQVQHPAPTLTTTSLGVNPTATGSASLPWTQSSLQPVYMGMGFSRLEPSQAVILYTVIGLAVVTSPVWVPIYLLFDCFDGH